MKDIWSRFEHFTLSFRSKARAELHSCFLKDDRVSPHSIHMNEEKAREEKNKRGGRRKKEEEGKREEKKKDIWLLHIYFHIDIHWGVRGA